MLIRRCTSLTAVQAKKKRLLRWSWWRIQHDVILIVTALLSINQAILVVPPVVAVAALITPPPSSSSSTTNTKTSFSTTITGVTLKLALDQQWAVADGPTTTTTLQPQRFTCSESLDLVHRLRRDCQGVLVGRTTVERDDCSLTVRRVPTLSQQPQPTRIIIDPRLSLLLLPKSKAITTTSSLVSLSDVIISIPNYQIFQDGYPTLIYHTVHAFADPSLLASYLPESVQCIYLPPETANSNDNVNSNDSSFMRHDEIKNHRLGIISPRAIWDHLQQHHHMSHILVEGGPTTARQFLHVVDRILLIRAPIQFQNQPVVASHLSNDLLQQSGFCYLGQAMSGVDTLEYWTRPHLPWPSATSNLADWP